MESRARNKRSGFKMGLAYLTTLVTLYSSATVAYYYKANEVLESMKPTARADKAQEYVESWKRAPVIMKYNPFEVGMYFSAKKYAQENPLKKKEGIEI